MSKLRKEAVAGSTSKQVPKRAASALVLGSPLSSSASGEEDITMSMSSSSADPSSAIAKPRPRPTSKLVSKPAPLRPKSTALVHSSSVSDVSTKDKNDEGSSSSSTSSTLASAPAPSNSITQRLSRVGKNIASKYSTLPLPPKSKDPASPKPTSSGLSQSSKGSPTIRMSPHQIQLQQQAQELQLQIQQQKLLLEEQQKQLQNSQHTQQELELRLQQQNTEKQLQQQILEQQLLQQQLELEEQHREQQRQQARFKMHLHQMNQSGPVPSQYSVSARTYMNLFPFQQHHADKQANPSPTDFIQGPTFVAEFAYSPTQAVENFKDWKNSQWLLPHGFANQLDPLSVVPTFLPFYVFSLFSHSVCSGRVGYFKNADDHTGGLFSMDFEFKDDFQKSNTQSQLHPNVLVYAPTTELVSTPDYESLQDISFWNLDEAILKPHTSLTARSLPSPTKPNTAIDIKMLRGIPIADAWTHARRKVVKNERYCSAQILKRDCRCDVVESVTTDTSFSHIVVKLIYLPVYVWTHAYQGETYHTVMNGQNGLIGGRRPFALKNSLDSCMKLFNGGEQAHEKTETIASIITGAELSRRDSFTDQNSSPYRHDAHYVVLPPSTQFLVVVATGWIRLANIAPRTEREGREGSEREGSVTIVAQRRASHTTSPHELVIPPQEERTFSYKGAWCLGIVSGSHQHLVVRAVSPDAGHDKEDLLGML